MSQAFPGLDPQRAWQRLEHLAGLTVPGVPWTRRAFTPLFAQARTYLAGAFAEAGLQVHTDAAGNLVGRRAGSAGQARPIISGSHSDTVVGGGRYDGILGVVAALEVAQALHAAGTVLRHPLEVIDFLSEEPSDYGVSCVGSRAIGGVLGEAMLACRDAQGESLAQGMQRMGYAPDQLGQVQRPAGSTAAYVELHIEQGPVLEARGLPIGVVTAIVGIRRVRLVVEGQPDHAGTTPMDIRRDALVGAARLIDRVHAYASALSGNPHYVVATIGRLHMTPNVPNAVPGRVEMILEVRSDDGGVLDSFPEDILLLLAPELESLRLHCSLEEVSRAEPTACQAPVMQAIERAAASCGHASLRMTSGAGHDAVYMAATGPVGMVFIPCLDGRSHCPQESITPAQMEAGLEVLYRTVLELDRALAP